MNWFDFFITYIVCWWLVLFMVLPFGVRAPVQPGLGHVPSAPENPRLKRKFLITSLLALLPALLLMAIVDARAESGIYHAGSGGCKPLPTYIPPADLHATDSNATLNPNPVAGMDDISVGMYLPVDPYLNKPQPGGAQADSKYNVDTTQSDILLGRIEVKKDGGTTLNGQPIGGQDVYSKDCVPATK